MSENEKKKNQLIDIRHTRQKRYWYILSWTVWTGAPYFWFCSLALKPWKLSWIFTHLVPSERSLQKKKNNTCGSSNHFKGFSFNSHWNYNKICAWNLVLHSGLWPWTFSLLVTFNKVFNFHQKLYFYKSYIYIPIFLSSGHKIYYARHYQQFLVSIKKSYLSFEKTWLPLSHKYLTCWWSKYRNLNSSCNQNHM